MSYRLLSRAARDVGNIWRYTYNKWSERQADKYQNDLVAAFEKIAQSPFCGRLYRHRNLNLYTYHVGRHVIFYRIEPKEQITIIRILHESMDLDDTKRFGA